MRNEQNLVFDEICNKQKNKYDHKLGLTIIDGIFYGLQGQLNLQYISIF